MQANNLKEQIRASLDYLAGVAQLVSSLSFVLKVPGSILSNTNICFYFSTSLVALVLHTEN